MILMCIVIVGVLVISFIVYLEGSLTVDPVIFVHLVIPSFVLILNLYVIMLDDDEEERFFKNGKKMIVNGVSSSGAGKGVFLINFALIASVIALATACYMKFLSKSINGSGGANQMGGSSSYVDPEDEEGGQIDSLDSITFIEECLMHALAVIQSITLREYARSKLKDIVGSRKRR